ncbi:hypothetical protein [Thalassospira sp.]|uniref:hypothetical protein n=1 Tax=Thalassospira sp. TaxID=1912094 RepID=UPI001B027758|nr:hypothetical protein [Thalassospira sp.]MBO6807531.1 hypothetical protein [Thalassospira sp.]MBO6840056.1 hypothetical protein [Thalassospira sp.]
MLYDQGEKALEVGSYKENLGKAFPSIALNDELASGLVDLSEGACSAELMKDALEQVVLFTACLGDLERVIDQIKAQGLHREQMERFLPLAFEETGGLESLELLYSRGVAKLKVLLGKL